MDRRLSAILAADVIEFSKMMSQDETGTLYALKEHRARVFDPLMRSHHGRLVKLMGDGALVEFTSVVDAVECAIAIQTEQSNAGETKVILRIGVHLGDVMIDGEDIYGDGVNIASRLEAQAKPGGVCISGIVRDSLGPKIGDVFSDGGTPQLKNIERPLQVYHWEMVESEPEKKMNTPLPQKPSIAVLPFTNMSGDQEQEYFSDGVAEDIITELSRFSELFVIARNSSFVFKGQAVDIKLAGQKLGVQYIVEGSVRKVGSRVRVTAQLIDALSGAHLWADRYDRELEDIFEVQDDVVRAIVAVLPGRIAEAGAENSRRKPTESLTAFDYLLRGNHALARRGDNLKRAIEYYHSALKIDPDCAAAFAGIALAEGMSIWDLSTYADNPLSRAYDAGKQALALDQADYRSHAAFGQATRQLGQHSVARLHLQRAMALNPNSAEVLGFWAMLQNYTGDPEGGVETYYRAIHLDPLSQENVRPEILAEAYYMMGEYQKSIDVLTSMLKLPIFFVHQQLAISYARLGDMDAVSRHMDEYRSQLPESYDENLLFESHIRLCEREKDREQWRKGYRLIGMDV